MQHRIHISGERVTGAVALTSHEPVIAAAKALLALGHPPSDQLSVIGPDVTFSPMPLGKLAAPRQRTLRSVADYQHHLARQEPISAPPRR